MFMIIIC